MSKKAVELARRYGRKTDIIEIIQDIIDEQYRISAYNNPPCAIVTRDAQMQVYNWGLIPFWVKDANTAASIRKGTINARSETLFEKPSYRNIVFRKRCLIPSTGYFEHHHNPNKTTTPYFISVSNQEIFSMGGLYDIWRDPTSGKFFQTFTQITTPANELTGRIHNGGNNPHRMPLIIRPDQEELWLNPELSITELQEMMIPFPAKQMTAYAVYNDFLKKDPDDKSILDKVS